MIVDAGSTGCRAHTFEIVPGAAKPRFQLRAIGKKVKGHTPLASLAGVGDDAVAESHRADARAGAGQGARG